MAFLSENPTDVVIGNYNIGLLDQLQERSELQFVGCCNELNAGYAADGSARAASTRVSVLVVTFTVGSLSAINAVAGAYSEGLPVVVISGSPSSRTIGQQLRLHHTTGEADHDQALNMFRPITAASVRLSAEDPTSVLDQTLRICLESSLPVYVEVPTDVALMPVEEHLKPLPRPPPSTLSSLGCTPQVVASFVEYWNQVRNPILIVGPLVRRFLSKRSLVGLVEKLGCAVLCHFDGKSLVPEDHPQFAGAYCGSATFPDTTRAIVDQADFFVELGGRWVNSYPDVPSRATVTIQPDHIRFPDRQEFSDIPMADLVTALLKSSIRRKTSSVHKSRTSTLCKDCTQSPSDSSQVKLSNILSEIQNLIDPLDTLIADTGDTMFCAQDIRLPRGADFQTQTLYASIGWSIPAAMGLQLARPEGRAVVMIGDGSFQMTGHEISTMLRLKVRPIIVIFNNLGYRIEVSASYS